jgi:hypothetical protein
MLNINTWIDSLSDFETSAFISWLMINGVNSPDELPSFLKGITHDIDLASISLEDLLTIFNCIKAKNFKRVQDEFHYHITISVGRLIGICFEDDIQSQTINLAEYQKKISEALIPLGINCNYLFSYVINIRDDAVNGAIAAHEKSWPYPPHKLDHFYNQLLRYQFIEPSGHFKDIFLVENPPQKSRVLWKKNRTDLIYLGYKLYNEVYKDNFIDTIDRLFYTKNNAGQIATLNQLKKTYRNIRDQFNQTELKKNWKLIDKIFKIIPLP